jgi:hypothetical protein
MPQPPTAKNGFKRTQSTLPAHPLLAVPTPLPLLLLLLLLPLLPLLLLLLLLPLLPMTHPTRPAGVPRGRTIRAPAESVPAAAASTFLWNFLLLFTASLLLLMTSVRSLLRPGSRSWKDQHR